MRRTRTTTRDRRSGRLWVIGLCLLLAAGTARAEAPRRAPVPREVVVINRSANAIHQLYVSPNTADQWGEDRLGDNTIERGGSFKVRLGRTRECLFDIQVIYSDAGREENRNVDLCTTRQVSFDGTRAMIPPELSSTEHRITLVNRSGRRIVQVFASPSAAEQWGDDRLAPAGPIDMDASQSVAYRGACVSDLRVIYDNQSAEERRGLDLCAMPSLLIRPGWTTDDTPPTPGVAMESDAADTATGEITLRNQSGSAVTEFYLFPDDGSHDSADRGADILGNDVLPNGGQVVLSFTHQRVCRFAAHALHGGDRPRQDLTGIDLCHSGTIIIPPPPRHGSIDKYARMG